MIIEGPAPCSARLGRELGPVTQDLSIGAPHAAYAGTRSSCSLMQIEPRLKLLEPTSWYRGYAKESDESLEIDAWHDMLTSGICW